MPHDLGCIIRKYESRDRAAVREISCLTALMGEPSAIFFDDDEILADALTLYFTDHEPESCWVVECKEKVVGYLIGAVDVARSHQITAQKITFALVMKAFRRGTIFRGKNIRFFFHVLLSALKGELKAPAFSKEYPATLHINILKEYRGGGWGSALINVYLDHLRSKAVKGVHFATMSDQASQFYNKLGFQLLFQGNRSYFRYFLGKDISIYIYGMRLSTPSDVTSL
jgi:GNAT superfamily N-acetyltransferase